MKAPHSQRLEAACKPSHLARVQCLLWEAKQTLRSLSSTGRAVGPQRTLARFLMWHTAKFSDSIVPGSTNGMNGSYADAES